jgi:hypothetical protein
MLFIYETILSVLMIKASRLGVGFSGQSRIAAAHKHHIASAWHSTRWQMIYVALNAFVFLWASAFAG